MIFHVSQPLWSHFWETLKAGIDKKNSSQLEGESTIHWRVNIFQRFNSLCCYFLLCRLKHFSFLLDSQSPHPLRCSSLIVKTWWPFRLPFSVSSIHSTTSEHQQSAMTEKKIRGLKLWMVRVLGTELMMATTKLVLWPETLLITMRPLMTCKFYN